MRASSPSDIRAHPSRAAPLALGLLLAVLFLAPSGTADVGLANPDDPTPTTLYFHLIDGFNDFPINTQPPSDLWTVGAGKGLASHSTSCLPDTGASPLLSKEWHTWYGYSSPSEVQYDVEENGLPRVHPERGFSYDVRLDTSQQPLLHWYLETQAAGAFDDAPVVVPNVVVQATMRTGSAIGIGDENYDQGDILATGRSGPALLAGDHTDGATYIPGDRHVYGFEIPLDLQSSVLPSETGFNVRIDVWLDNPACAGGAGGYVMPNTVRLHTGPDARPRMQLTTLNPVQVDVVHPQFIGDDLVVHVEANSPWGSYDVDERGGIDLSIQGPSTPRDVQIVVTDHIHAHGPTAHFQPLTVAAIWPYKAEQAGDGLYTVSFAAWNDQHTAEATGTSTFEIGSLQRVCYQDSSKEACTVTTPTGPGSSVPGIPASAVLAALAALALLRRR